ncbi:14111_t:CDS:2 [Entrophospora sp. SA101]|nr:14111_t:CDS:2 [Entrophospora sp. SA101]
MAGATGSHGFPVPGRGYVFASKLLGGFAAFWILYRGKQDLPGLKHPWEAHGHHHGHHSPIKDSTLLNEEKS